MDWNSALLRKCKGIFSIAPMESLEKSPECFLTEKHSPLTGCSVYASGVLAVSGDIRVRHQTLGTGRSLNPIGESGAT